MSVRILTGDCRDLLPTLPEASVHCVVTSPPYWGLRDYGVVGQLGLEPTPEAYLEAMVGVFRAVRRVLRDDGTCWVNMGDCYTSGGRESFGPGTNKGQPKDAPRAAQPDGLKPKDLVGMPWRLAFALQADGWYLRSDIIWAKPNPMPESVTDRPTKAHEYVFLLTKSARYYYDADAVREPVTRPELLECRRNVGWIGTANGMKRPAGMQGGAYANPAGRNLRSVWTIATEPTPDAHFATFPQKLVQPCILAGTSEKGCCAACGAPWVREVEATYAKSPDHGGKSKMGRVNGHGRGISGRMDGSGYPRLDKHVVTTGWSPSCACDAAVVPCTVLDPFGGTGTVGRVAEDLGRDAILIELNAAYVTLAQRKTAQRGLFASR